MIPVEGEEKRLLIADLHKQQSNPPRLRWGHKLRFSPESWT